MANRVAVLLSGCGVFDGSEIHEAVLTLLALDSAGAEVVCCAPDCDQVETVNHLTGSKTSERRNMLVEAARIARGSITNLSDIRAESFDALIMPGGYGAVKNLCNYSSAGVGASVHSEVARVVREFVAAKKPVGAICIAPMLVARVLSDVPGVKAQMTVGNDEVCSRDMAELGAEHVCCPVKEFVVDKENKIVSTPAYMLGKGPSEVYAGIEKLVKATLELCGTR